MTDVRAPIFDAIKAARGKGWTGEEIARTDAFLDGFGIGRASKAAVGTHRLHDEGAFYAGMRRVTGGFNDTQFATIKGLLAAAAHWPVSWVAYGFATAWGEAKFEPVPEIGRGRGKPYGAPGRHGQAQYGRGLPQITWDKNYEWADAALDMNGSLLADFDRALEPTITTAILVKGMEQGAFTTRSLATYLPNRLGTVKQFTSARRIINGTDRAAQFAGYALSFQDALVAGEWT